MDKREIPPSPAFGGRGFRNLGDPNGFSRLVIFFEFQGKSLV